MPNVLLRIGLAGSLVCVAALPRNPLVAAEARLGLSPSPLEKLLHVKGPFCGMTEGFFRLAHLDLGASFGANCFSPLYASGALWCILAGRHPRVRDSRTELAFFLFMGIQAVMVNLVN